MTEALSGRPYASVGIPGRDMGLKLLLDKAADGTGVLIAIPYRIVGTAADGSRSRTCSRRSTSSAATPRCRRISTCRSG